MKIFIEIYGIFIEINQHKIVVTMQPETSVYVTLADYDYECVTGRDSVIGTFKFTHDTNLGYVIAYIIYKISHFASTDKSCVPISGNTVFTDFFRMSFTLGHNSQRYIYNLKKSEKKHNDRFALTDLVGLYGSNFYIRVYYNRFRKRRNTYMISDLLNVNTPCRPKIYSVLHKLMLAQLNSYPVNDRMLTRQKIMHRNRTEYVNFMYTHWRNGVIFMYYTRDILPFDVINIIKSMFIDLAKN